MVREELESKVNQTETGQAFVHSCVDMKLPRVPESLRRIASVLEEFSAPSDALTLDVEGAAGIGHSKLGGARDHRIPQSGTVRDANSDWICGSSDWWIVTKRLACANKYPLIQQSNNPIFNRPSKDFQ